MTKQTVYICVGLPGSGKSTHSKTEEFVSHCIKGVSAAEKVVRINQDTLGSRGACNDLAARSLAAGMSIIVDRCNVSKSQRKYWIDLAKRRSARVVVEHFDVDHGLCLDRVNKRTGHETMTNPASFRAIVAGFRATWQDPTLDEGIDEIRIRDESGKITETRNPWRALEKRSLWYRIKRRLFG